MLLDFISERGAVHPREVQEHFAHGRVRNYWGGSSHATTQMLDTLHYRGLLRVARREKGIRVYRTHRHAVEPLDDAARQGRIDALVDVAMNIYAPLPAASLSYYVRRLRYAVPQWANEITGALQRARVRLAHARVDGMDWYWPNEENPRRSIAPETVRLLAPFDPVVHDRTRFELFWGWVYRFEAYTPAPKRKLGYYAAPPPLARSCDRLGQSGGEEWRPNERTGLCGRAAAKRSCFQTRTRSGAGADPGLSRREGLVAPEWRVIRADGDSLRFCGRFLVKLIAARSFFKSLKGLCVLSVILLMIFLGRIEFHCWQNLRYHRFVELA